MSCEKQNVFQIFKGDDKTMRLKALYADTIDPLDLTSCTAIDVALPNQDGTIAHVTLASGAVTILSPTVLGKFTVAVASIVSQFLNPGEFQNFDVTFTIGGEKMTVRYQGALSVFEP